jgi:hypothetical protein
MRATVLISVAVEVAMKLSVGFAAALVACHYLVGA